MGITVLIGFCMVNSVVSDPGHWATLKSSATYYGKDYLNKTVGAKTSMCEESMKAYSNTECRQKIK
jgi:hypothetical protein